MVYGIDLRKGLIWQVEAEYLKKETGALFVMGTNSFYLWKNSQRKRDFGAKPRTRSPRKLPLDTSRFVRPYLVRGKVGQKIVPPMIDRGRMTGDFFTECQEEELLPALSDSPVIVMDKVPFHSKQKLGRYYSCHLILLICIPQSSSGQF